MRMGLAVAMACGKIGVIPPVGVLAFVLIFGMG